MVGFQKRFSRVLQQAKQIVDAGSLGELMFFRAHAFSSDILRAGRSWRLRRGTGGVLLDLAPHLLDLVIWLFDEPRSVEAVKKQFYSKEVDDYVHAMMSFSSGLHGHLDACWSLREFRLPEIWIEVRGTNGSLTATDDYVTTSLHKDGETVNCMYYKQSFDDSVPFLLAYPEYTLEDEAFLGSEKMIPGVSFGDAARVNHLIDEIEKAAQ
jgi:predicted dehydrogenase